MAQKTSSSGKISSNVEPDKEIDGLFDYGSITERDKAVVNEVTNGQFNMLKWDNTSYWVFGRFRLFGRNGTKISN